MWGFLRRSRRVAGAWLYFAVSRTTLHVNPQTAPAHLLQTPIDANRQFEALPRPAALPVGPGWLGHRKNHLCSLPVRALPVGLALRPASSGQMALKGKKKIGKEKANARFDEVSRESSASSSPGSSAKVRNWVYCVGNSSQSQQQVRTAACGPRLHWAVFSLGRNVGI